MTMIDGHTVGDEERATYTVTPKSYLVDFVTHRLAVEVSVTPPNRTVDTLWAIDDDVVEPLWRPSGRYSDEHLSAALEGAAEFIRQSENLQYRVGEFPPEVVAVDTRVRPPNVE